VSDFFLNKNKFDEIMGTILKKKSLNTIFEAGVKNECAGA